ncbi:MAG: MFS transporter [Candidatus Korarchaeota archaeon]|nr:MFS transporter [Candidatus Korarchaeota archaeon]
MADRWKVLIAAFLRDLSWSMTFLYVAFETYERGSVLEYALIRGVPALAYFLGTRIYGSLSDQMGARKPLMLAAAALNPLFPLAIALTGPSSWLPIVVAWYFFLSEEPVIIAFLADRSPGGAAAGDYFMAMEVGFTVGVLIGGLLTEWLGLRRTLLMASALSSLAVAALATVREEGRLERPDFLRAVRSALGLRWPGDTGRIVPSLLLASSAISTFYVAFSLKVFEASGRSDAVIGLLVSAAGLTGAIMGPIYGRIVDRIGGIRAFTASCLLYALYFVVGSLVSDFKVLAALMVIPLFALHYSARNALAISLAPDEKAAASSVTSAMGSISEALGNGLGGVIMGFWGMSAAMWIAAALSASAAPILEVARPSESGGREFNSI